MKTKSSTSISARVSKTILAALVVTAFAVSPAHAEEKAAASADSTGKIAVVDIQYLVGGSKAGKSIRTQLESKRDAYRKEIEKQEAELNKQGRELKDQQASLSKEEMVKRYKALDEKARKGQQGVLERTKAFEKAYVESLEKLREHIVKIVADIAGKNGISLVLNRQEVVLVESKMDLTKQVLTALDKEVTSIPVNIK
jgi:Skp family chaperone for outer membrane proteins